MSIFYLSKQGYGSVNEIATWDTDRFLNAIEYEYIQNSIEAETYRRESKK